MTATRLKERIGKAVFAAAAVICVIAVVAIFAFLIYKSIPAFGKLGVFRFMFGDNWSPDRLDTYDSPLSGTYGILTMIAGTLTATVGALLVGGVLGYFTAIFLAFYCPPAPRRVLSAVINLLAGIPVGGIRLLRHRVSSPSAGAHRPQQRQRTAGNLPDSGHHDPADRRVAVTHQSGGSPALLLRGIGCHGRHAQRDGVPHHVPGGTLRHHGIADSGHRTGSGRNHGSGNGGRPTRPLTRAVCSPPSAC